MTSGFLWSKRKPSITDFYVLLNSRGKGSSIMLYWLHGYWVKKRNHKAKLFFSFLNEVINNFYTNTMKFQGISELKLGSLYPFGQNRMTEMTELGSSEDFPRIRSVISLLGDTGPGAWPPYPPQLHPSTGDLLKMFSGFRTLVSCRWDRTQELQWASWGERSGILEGEI